MLQVTVSLFEILKLIVVSNVVVYLLTNRAYCVSMNTYMVKVYDSIFKDL